MHLMEVRARDFRRFTDLTIRISPTPRLVVLAGPNGSGKSSLFDAFRLWSGLHGMGWQQDNEYFVKRTDLALTADQVEVQFHESADLGGSSVAARKAFYVRTAYRNDPEFATQQLQRVGSPLETPAQTAQRMIDNDVRVTENYQRLVALTLDDVYDGEHDDLQIRDVRESYIGTLRDALRRIFPDLTLTGPGDPLGGGTFRFRKGATSNFPYKNLSGGERRRSTCS
ncbi:MAG: hypothetical protein QOF43_1611 [Gaiellaceae bacterium]|jgi:hypothetical protein|nr:hypothetical protein [Gaiellaceae bacterium]